MSECCESLFVVDQMALMHQPSKSSSHAHDPPTAETLFGNSLLDWVATNRSGEEHSETGIASLLYEACLRTLSILSVQYSGFDKATTLQKTRIADSLARLCLWGDGLLEDGKLESCLKTDVDLRDDLVALLYQLGRVLVHGKHCNFV